jgi:hypothetical protein
MKIGYNCNINLTYCYPNSVDAVACKCSENKTVSPLLNVTTTGEMVTWRLYCY